MLDQSGSFIVTVGNVIQSPTDYTIDSTNRRLTFSSIVTAGIEVGVTQLATAAPSSANFNYVQSVSANFTNLSATNGFINNLVVTSLTALSATINVIDINVYELSGFRVTGNLIVDGTTTTNILSAVNVTTQNIATQGLSSRFINLEHTVPNDGVNPVLFIGERGDGTGGTVVGSLSGFNTIYDEVNNKLVVTTQLGSVVPLTAVTIDSTGNVGIGTLTPNRPLTVFGSISATEGISVTSLSSRFINLEHSVPNDGINPVLFIGERGDGSSGTITGSLSGFNTTYDEPNNRLIVSTQFGSVTPLTAVTIDSIGNVGIGTNNPTSSLTIAGGYATAPPITITVSPYTVPLSASTLIINFSASIVLTLPSAASYPGRWLTVKTLSAFNVNSASTNIAPLTSANVNNIILPQSTVAASGKYARLQSDGSNWVVMIAN